MVRTADVPDHGIVGGDHARRIRTRYDERDIARLPAVACHAARLLVTARKRG